MVDRRNSGASPVPHRPWPLLRVPQASASFIVLVDVLALGWLLGLSLTASQSQLRDWLVLLLLAVLAVVFEECARRAATLKLRLAVGMKRDMTSVWCVAGAVVLPALQAGLLLTVTLIYVWFRQHRPAGEIVYKKVFNWATAVVGCLVANFAYDAVREGMGSFDVSLTAAFGILVAMAAYTAANRGLVTIAALTLGMRGRDLLGSFDDNMMEIATLSLGGLVAAAVTYHPWSAVFVVVPMLALQRGALVRELETAAATDSKTGLLNAIAWEQLAAREVARATREKYALSILIIDIDRFKDVNDRFGHLVGDEVLVGIGRTIKGALREYDGLGRFGGEEFVAVLPEAGDEVGTVIAERIRGRISQLTVAGLVDDLPEAADHPLSVSIGVACLPTDGFDLAELLHGSDRALYVAKAAGRNRVVLARRGGEAEEDVVVA